MCIRIAGIFLSAAILSGCINEKPAEQIYNKGFNVDNFRVEMASKSDNDSFFEQTELFKNAPTKMYKYTLSELTSYQSFERGTDKNLLTTFDWSVIDSSPIWQPHNDRQKSSYLDKNLGRYWRAYEVFTLVDGDEYKIEAPIESTYVLPAYSQMISGLMIDNGDVLVSYPEQVTKKLKENEVRRSVDELVGVILKKINEDRNIRIEKDKLAQRAI